MSSGSNSITRIDPDREGGVRGRIADRVSPGEWGEVAVNDIVALSKRRYTLSAAICLLSIVLAENAVKVLLSPEMMH